MGDSWGVLGYQILSLPWGPSWGQMGFLGLCLGRAARLGLGVPSSSPPGTGAALFPQKAQQEGFSRSLLGSPLPEGGMGGVQKEGRGGALVSPLGPVPQGNCWPWCDPPGYRPTLSCSLAGPHPPSTLS